MSNDSFSPMGLNQQDLIDMLYKNVKPKGNWTDKIKQALRVRGQSEFYTRFIWKNLPNGIDGQELERMLYYRAFVGLFYDKEFGFLFLPVKQATKPNSNSIGFRGRWKYAEPVPFNGAGEDKKQDEQRNKTDRLVLATIGPKEIQWDIPFVESKEDAIKTMENSCVLLYDYTPQISQIPLSREELENPFYDGEVEIIKMIRTASLNSTGVVWIRVNTEAEADLMRNQFKIYDDMILNGTRYLCVASTTEMQEGSTKSTAQMQEFWASWQSLENLRQSCIGLGNDGVQQKSQYQNIQEQSLDNIGNSPVLLDGWLQRVKFCTIANALWGLNIGVEVAGMDTSGEQPETESKDEGQKGDINNNETEN